MGVGSTEKTNAADQGIDIGMETIQEAFSRIDAFTLSLVDIFRDSAYINQNVQISLKTSHGNCLGLFIAQ